MLCLYTSFFFLLDNIGDVGKSIQEAYTLVLDIACQIEDSSITVETIELIEKRKEAFLELCTVVNQRGKKSVSVNFEKRCSEVKELRRGVEVMEYFLEIYKMLPPPKCKLFLFSFFSV